MTEADYGDAAGDAAAAALTAVHRQGRCTSAAMLDAMEAAEASFERQQAAAGRSGASGATGMAGLRRDAAAGGAVAAGHALPPDTPRKAAICEGTRERMVQALFQSLQDNPRYVPLACSKFLLAKAGVWLGLPPGAALLANDLSRGAGWPGRRSSTSVIAVRLLAPALLKCIALRTVSALQVRDGAFPLCHEPSRRSRGLPLRLLPLQADRKSVV